jgi:hypothetical protein
MPTPNTYGVTPAIIAGRVQGLTISATTTPSQATVEDMIEECAEHLASELVNIGFDPTDLPSTQTPYNTLRAALIYRVAYLILVGRDRAQEGIAQSYKVAYDELMATIRVRPARVVGPSDAPDSVRSPVLEPDLAASTARAATLAGRIIRGGL